MPDYYTSTSTEGLRFPYSGVIVGKLAEALRLKAALREDFQAVSYKTVQRYFIKSEPSMLEFPRRARRRRRRRRARASAGTCL